MVKATEVTPDRNQPIILHGLHFSTTELFRRSAYSLVETDVKIARPRCLRETRNFRKSKNERSCPQSPSTPDHRSVLIWRLQARKVLMSRHQCQLKSFDEVFLRHSDAHSHCSCFMCQCANCQYLCWASSRKNNWYQVAYEVYMSHSVTFEVGFTILM